MTNQPSLKGAWLRHVTRFKFWGPMHISGMAEARAHKFCTKGDYINSCQKEDKSPLKGAWFCSCDRFVCTTVELEKNLNGSWLFVTVFVANLLV